MILCREHALHHILIGPCVASVVKVEPMSAAQIVYSLSRMLRTFSQKLFSGLHST